MTLYSDKSRKAEAITQSILNNLKKKKKGGGGGEDGSSWKPSIAITFKTKKNLSWLSYVPPKKQLVELKEREKGLTGTPRDKPQPPKLLSYTTHVRYLPY